MVVVVGSGGVETGVEELRVHGEHGVYEYTLAGSLGGEDEEDKREWRWVYMKAGVG